MHCIIITFIFLFLLPIDIPDTYVSLRKLNRLEPTREIRSLFGMPSRMPKYIAGATPEKYILIDEYKSAHYYLVRTCYNQSQITFIALKVIIYGHVSATHRRHYSVCNSRYWCSSLCIRTFQGMCKFLSSSFCASQAKSYM